MIFRQLFEKLSCTYTYLLGSEETGQAMLIDPVLPSWQRDLEVINDLGLTLVYTVETHIHADHITSAKQLRQEVGSRIAVSALDGLECADEALEEGRPFILDDIELQPLHTPGHTDNHMCYLVNDRVLSGDALLIDGCGRTDFQNGNADALYRSLTQKLFTLPDDCLVYPAHDYHGRHVSSIAQEKERNPRVGGDRTQREFVEIMHNLDLPYPRFIDYAVPGNQACGECPPDIPAHLEKYCSDMEASLQG